MDIVLKTALTAPCSFGHHPVELVLVEGAENIHKLAECKSKGGSQIEGAGAVIVVASNLELGKFWIEDAAIASSYILLAAEQQSLGACWVHIRNRDGQNLSADEEIRALLNIPENYAALNLIALDGKAEDKPPYTDADFDMGKIHYGKLNHIKKEACV